MTFGNNAYRFDGFLTMENISNSVINDGAIKDNHCLNQAQGVENITTVLRCEIVFYINAEHGSTGHLLGNGVNAPEYEINKPPPKTRGT